MPSGRCCLHFPWGRAGGKLKYLWLWGSECHPHVGDNRWLERVKWGLILQPGCGQLPGRIQGIHCKQRNVELMRVGGGDEGQVKSGRGGGGGGVLRRMSLLTHKWGLISRGGLAFYSWAERRYTAVTRPPRPDPTKDGHLESQRNWGSLELPWGANLMSHGHMFISVMIDVYHSHCLSSLRAKVIIRRQLFNTKSSS